MRKIDGFGSKPKVSFGDASYPAIWSFSGVPQGTRFLHVLSHCQINHEVIGKSESNMAMIFQVVLKEEEAFEQGKPRESNGFIQPIAFIFSGEECDGKIFPSG